MDNRKLEQRIATLEQQLESLEGRYVAHLRSEGPRLGELEIKVQGLEARLKDFDKVETLVFDAYLHSHPEAQEGILGDRSHGRYGRAGLLFSKPSHGQIRKKISPS